MKKTAGRKAHLSAHGRDMWTEIHRPRCFSDLIGCDQQIEQMKKWYETFKRQVLTREETPSHPSDCVKKGLLLVGAPGIGKTSIARAFMRFFGWEYRYYSAVDVRNYSTLATELDELINYTNTAIIMDEVDGLKSRSVLVLQKIFNPNRGKGSVTHKAKLEAHRKRIPPIICICNTEHTEQINKLGMDCEVINFLEPTLESIGQLIHRIADRESFTIDKEATAFVARHAQGDFRRAISILQNAVLSAEGPAAGTGTGTGTGVNITLAHLDRLNRVYGPKTSYRREELLPYMILTAHPTYKSMRDAHQIVKAGEQHNKISALIHGNYHHLIGMHPTSEMERLNTMKHCIDLIAKGDHICNLIRTAQHSTKPAIIKQLSNLNNIYLPLRLIHNYPVDDRIALETGSDLTHHNILHRNRKTLGTFMRTQTRDISTSELHLMTVLIAQSHGPVRQKHLHSMHIHSKPLLRKLNNANKLNKIPARDIKLLEGSVTTRQTKPTKQVVSAKSTRSLAKLTSKPLSRPTSKPKIKLARPSISLKPSIIKRVNAFV